MNFYDAILNNENLRVKIILPPQSGKSPDENRNANDNSVILGYLENPFEVNSSLEWSDKLFGTDYSNTFNKAMQAIGKDTQLLTVFDTEQQPIISRIPEFQLSFYVINTNTSSNAMKKVLRLYEATYPEKLSSGTVRYHWGYTANAAGESGNGMAQLQSSPTTGTVIITIGKWFRALNMIIKSVSIQYSENVGIDGRPIWVRPTVLVSPRRLPYADEFKSMFRVDDMGAS